MTKTAIQMIPIDSIKIANPRVRNARIHKSITENIDKVGLKRPITVRRLGDPADERYALVCGQGRLESFQMLGQAMVPAIIIDVDSETGYVMSIVENIARRTPRASEMMDQISNLQKRGYGDADIAKKIGYTTAWVNNVTLLLEKGERRLLAAAEAGHIPLNLAVEISRVSDSDAQMLLLEAYERGELKGKKISAARRILEQRIRSGKSRPIGAFGFNKPSKKLSTEELARLYQEDTERHRLIQKKSEHAKNTILLAQQIFKELYADMEFCELLKSENLNSVPKPLIDFARHGGHV